MIYGNKLGELRENLNLTKVEISKYLKINKDVYGQYEREYVVIPIKHLITLCDYFNTSLDYVFSFTNTISYSNEIKGIDNIKAGKRLKEFRKEKRLTQEKLASILNTDRSALSYYEKGRNPISTLFLYTICKKYKISADYLLGKIDEPKYLN